MRRQIKITVQVTMTVSQPPDSNFETRVIQRMLLVSKNAKKENKSRQNQVGEAARRSLAQYTHIPNKDNEKVMKTLILYNPTNNETLPLHHSKIKIANIPKINSPF